MNECYFFGTFGGAGFNENGIYRYRPALSSLPERVFCTESPSYMCVDASRRILYFIAERSDCCTFYSADISGGGFRLIDTFETDSLRGCCHISLSPDNKALYAACYSGGQAGRVGLDGKGAIKGLLSVFDHNEIYRSIPTKKHVHFAASVPDTSYVLVTDLGMDRLFLYSDSESGLEYITFFSLPVGGGCRHAEFGAKIGDKRYIYVITEYSNRLFTLTFDEKTTEFELLSDVDALPPYFYSKAAGGKAKSAGGAIKISPNGKYIAVSDRVLEYPDSLEGIIAVFSLDGALLPVDPVFYGSGGVHPRDLCFVGEDKLLVSNKNSSNAAFIDLITKETARIDVPAVSCAVRFCD